MNTALTNDQPDQASTILAIDPGSTQSGWALIDTHTCRPLAFDKTDNDDLLSMLTAGYVQDTRENSAPLPITHACIERIASYGMPVGAEVFDTCEWTGSFRYALALSTGVWPERVFRQSVKLHHTHSPGARDANVIQALRDRFAYGQRNHGKGTKAAPGFFYGFRADIWQAYALAVYTADTLREKATHPKSDEPGQGGHE